MGEIPRFNLFMYIENYKNRYFKERLINNMFTDVKYMRNKHIINMLLKYYEKETLKKYNTNGRTVINRSIYHRLENTTIDHEKKYEELFGKLDKIVKLGGKGNEKNRVSDNKNIKKEKEKLMSMKKMYTEGLQKIIVDDIISYKEDLLFITI